MKQDPRAERSRAAGLSAALALLSDGGVASLTHQNVSRQSGIGRTTVYRHWPTTPDLVLDLLKTFRMPLFEQVEGALARRIEHNVEIQAAHIFDTDYLAVYRAVQDVALVDGVRQALVEINQERVESVVRVVAPDYDLSSRWDQVTDVFSLVNGPLIQLAVFTGRRSPAVVATVVASVQEYLANYCAPGPLLARRSTRRV